MTAQKYNVDATRVESVRILGADVEAVYADFVTREGISNRLENDTGRADVLHNFLAPAFDIQPILVKQAVVPPKVVAHAVDAKIAAPKLSIPSVH